MADTPAGFDRAFAPAISVTAVQKIFLKKRLNKIDNRLLHHFIDYRRQGRGSPFPFIIQFGNLEFPLGLRNITGHAQVR